MKTFTKRGISALTLVLSLTGVSAQNTVLASWDLFQGYDTTEDTDAKVTTLTPNGGEFAKMPTEVWFTKSSPRVVPTEAAGDKGDYSLTARSDGRYWVLTEGYQNGVLRIENTEANAITDYTDPSQHNVYYEVTFPTTGYKEISIDYEIACGDNKEAPFEAVVSTDGGNTWFDAGNMTTAGTWWTYKKNSVAISANNKPKVIVRLIAGNGLTTNWNLRSLTIKGEASQGGQSVNEQGLTLTWPLRSGNDNATAAEASTEGLFSVAEHAYGSNLKITGVRSNEAVAPRTLFSPIDGNVGVANDANALTFTIVPKKGLKFRPTGVEFIASKVGTNGGNFDVVLSSGETVKTLATAFCPQLTKESPFVSECKYTVSDFEATDQPVTLKIYIKGLATGKEYAFADVIVTGDVEGSLEEVPSYTMNVTVGTPGAGTVSSNPAGAEFDEGTTLTVSATENFGYHFREWVSADGSTVSTSNPYTFTITDNTSLTAVYDKNNVYAVNLTLEGGANDNLVLFQPEGNVEGKIHYYEEGTQVKLTALSNRILTFSNWEDNSTSSERELTVTSDLDLTATFSCADYIVGWDLYYDTPNSERAADYKAESDNSGLLSLRNASGNTTSWLTRGIKNGQENGKYAARIWKFLSEEWYYEISFSSVGYSNLRLAAAVGDDYNTYSVINAEYSTDGVNFTKFGTFNPPFRGWDNEEFDLPAEAAGQQRVYIRFMPDRTSSLIGSKSDYDGTSVAEIFVLGESESADDDMPPVLVSSIPADKGTGASANGSIILNFNEKIMAGTGVATLGGEELTPTISGKNAVFRYTGLKYDTQYTFTLPEGAITDRSGNKCQAITLTFTTMERVQPQPRLFDAIVAQDGSGDYTTVQEAVDNAPSGRAIPWLIFVKNGRYNEHVDIPASKSSLHFIGQDRDKTVIYDNRLSGGANSYHVSLGATVVVNSNDCFFENITLENSYGHEKQDGPQALALNTSGDRTIFNNVAMLSYQDTWITPSTSNYRAYVYNSLIEGAVDFIYNSGNIYLESDTLLITRKSGGYIVAPSHGDDVEWGYVFNNCIITAPGDPSATSVWLGRPWHNKPKTVMLNTRAEVTIPATGWYETMGGIPAIWADWNTTDANGNLLDLSMRRDTYYYIDKDNNNARVEGKAKNHLTDEEAAQYTVKNVLSGKDNWQPEIKTEACDAPRATLKGGIISWDAVPYAICYLITRGDEVVGITSETTHTVGTASKAATDASYTIQAVNEYGGLSSKATVDEVFTGIDSVSTEAAAPVTTEYFDIHGYRLTSPVKGVNIVRLTYSDGTVTISKQVL